MTYEFYETWEETEKALIELEEAGIDYTYEDNAYDLENRKVGYAIYAEY